MALAILGLIFCARLFHHYFWLMLVGVVIYFAGAYPAVLNGMSNENGRKQMASQSMPQRCSKSSLAYSSTGVVMSMPAPNRPPCHGYNQPLVRSGMRQAVPNGTMCQLAKRLSYILRLMFDVKNLKWVKTNKAAKSCPNAVCQSKIPD